MSQKSISKSIKKIYQSFVVDELSDEDITHFFLSVLVSKSLTLLIDNDDLVLGVLASLVLRVLARAVLI